MAGHPTDYREEYNQLAYNYSLLGATDEDLAKFLGVCTSTITNWKKNYPQFLASIKNGKKKADSEVASKLYHRAMGYSHKEDKIFQYEGDPVIVPTIKHYPPDSTAAIFWLKNRQPKLWRDKQEIEHSGDLPNIPSELKVIIDRPKENASD
jgi:DNA-binding XRE family transcriptional regulator